MILTIDERAFSWFTNEFELKKPLSIRLFPQYAGFGQKHKGYSLAFSAESPANAEFIKEMDGITFYVEGNDLWFFDDAETRISIDDNGELQVLFKDLSASC